MFLGFLLQHKELIIILLLSLGIAASSGYIKILHNKNEALKSDNIVLRSNLDASNNSIKLLQDSISQQNEAVEKLKSEADQRVQSHAIEISAANSRAQTYKEQAQNILKSIPNSQDKCKSADNLINNEILKNVKK